MQPSSVVQVAKSYLLILLTYLLKVLYTLVRYNGNRKTNLLIGKMDSKQVRCQWLVSLYVLHVRVIIATPNPAVTHTRVVLRQQLLTMLEWLLYVLFFV